MGQSSVGFNPVFAAIRVKTFTYEEMLYPAPGHLAAQDRRPLR